MPRCTSFRHDGAHARSSPSVQRLPCPFEPTPIEKVGECAGSPLPNRGQQGKCGEDRLSLFERHVSDFAAVAAVPPERRPPVLLRNPVADEEDELERFDETDVRELAGCRKRFRQVTVVEGSTEGGGMPSPEWPRTHVPTLFPGLESR